MNINEAAIGINDHIQSHFKVGAIDGKYVRDVWTEFQWMSGVQFKELCFLVAKVMEPYKPPLLSLYLKVADAKGWKKPATERRAAPAPKPTTEQNHEIMIKDIQIMKPISARLTLRQAKEQKLNLPPQIVAALEARANEPEEILGNHEVSAGAPPSVGKQSHFAELREVRERARKIVACSRHNTAEWRQVYSAIATYHAHHCDDCMDILLQEMAGIRAPVAVAPPPDVKIETVPGRTIAEEDAPKPSRKPSPNVDHIPKARQEELDKEAEAEGIPF